MHYTRNKGLIRILPTCCDKS